MGCLTLPPIVLKHPLPLPPNQLEGAYASPWQKSCQARDLCKVDQLACRHRCKQSTLVQHTLDDSWHRNKGRRQGGKNTVGVVPPRLELAVCPRQVQCIRVQAQHHLGPPQAFDNASCIGDCSRDRLRSALIPKRGTTALPSAMPPLVGKAPLAPCPKTGSTSMPADAG
jgi:hypothetical protein